MQVKECQPSSEQMISGDDAEERLTRLYAAGVGDKSLGRLDHRPHRQLGSTRAPSEARTLTPPSLTISAPTLQHSPEC